jgi:group I intron endonuclease
MRDIISGIYAIVNTINGHQYIGSAVNISRRITRHKTELRNGEHHSRHLQNAWNKYGESAFSFSILKEVDKENLIINEQEFIDRIRPEYNVSPTAGSRFGCVHQESTKRKISNSHMGLRPSEETRQKLVTSHTGYEISEETKRKMSEATKGKYRGWADKTIFQYSREGELLMQFESIMDAQRATSIHNQSIVRCARGKRPTAGGFIWRYAEVNQ